MEPSLLDPDYEFIWQALSKSEDDVVFSQALSAEERSSPYDFAEILEYCDDADQVEASNFRDHSYVVHNPLLEGPAFLFPFANGHYPVRAFHGRLILSQVLGCFAPFLILLPRDMLLEALLDFFSPI
ncbi:unnamed protein product [Calypogeia fissa]